MSTGSLQSVIVCQASSTELAPCPAGQAPAVVQAYVLDPASSTFLDAIAQPFDYANGSAFWLSAFMFTLALYIGSRIYAAVIGVVR